METVDFGVALCCLASAFFLLELAVEGAGDWVPLFCDDDFGLRGLILCRTSWTSLLDLGQLASRKRGVNLTHGKGVLEPREQGCSGPLQAFFVCQHGCD